MKILYFGKNLKYLREKLGKAQGEMSAAIGFQRTTWNGYEKGDSYPKLEDFIKIAEYFDISETELLHTDFSKGKVIENKKPAEKSEKGKVKGKPKGKVNAENEGGGGLPRGPGESCKECERKDEIIQALRVTVRAQIDTVEALKLSAKLQEERIPEKQHSRRKAG